MGLQEELPGGRKDACFTLELDVEPWPRSPASHPAALEPGTSETPRKRSPRLVLAGAASKGGHRCQTRNRVPSGAAQFPLVTAEPVGTGFSTPPLSPAAHLGFTPVTLPSDRITCVRCERSGDRVSEGLAVSIAAPSVKQRFSGDDADGDAPSAPGRAPRAVGFWETPRHQAKRGGNTSEEAFTNAAAGQP